LISSEEELKDQLRNGVQQISERVVYDLGAEPN
jgi:hypothetical protein